MAGGIKKRLFGAIILVLLLVSSTSTAQEQESINVCFQDIAFRDFSFGEDETEHGIRIQWKAEQFIEGSDSPVELNISTFEKVEILYSTTDPGLTFNTITRPMNHTEFNLRPVNAQEKWHFLKVVCYLDGKAYASSVHMEAGLKDPGRTIFSPAALLFWVLREYDIWPEPFGVFQDSQFLGKRAFDFLALLFLTGTIILLPRIWWLFRSSRLFLVNRNVIASNGDKKYNECELVATKQSKRLVKTQYQKRFHDLVIAKLSRNAFHGRTFNWVVSHFTPSFLEFGARKQRDLAMVSSVKLVRTVVGAVNQDKDLEKAMEIRISAEHEDLRKRSFLDVLWAFGATAPLLGLFGTVTGISEAFFRLGTEDFSAVDVMGTLGKGIHEALWTTIMGLICGIMFMSAFYYYSYKLDRIYSLWTTFGAEALDMLKFNLDDNGDENPEQETGE